MTTWNEDEEVWRTLDNLMKNCRDDLDEFLTCLFKYHDSIDLVGQALLFGGLGKMVMNYNQAILATSPEESLAMAFQATYHDRRIQQLMGSATEAAIDAQIAKMKGE